MLLLLPLPPPSLPALCASTHSTSTSWLLHEEATSNAIVRRPRASAVLRQSLPEPPGRAKADTTQIERHCKLRDGCCLAAAAAARLLLHLIIIILKSQKNWPTSANCIRHWENDGQ